MTAATIETIASSWKSFKSATGLGHVANERQYDKVIALMDWLTDLGAMRKRHALHDLFLMAADLAHEYEQRRWPTRKVSAVEMLRFLMEQHGLRQGDLREEIGSQGVVSEILNGKRELNKHHIAALAKRFSVSPAVFFD
jgi:HTH-type transcriptional regulator/antitoxin HigA